MGFPAFFEKAPVIRMRDPLAAFLGACDDGVIEYCYADAVRLAGHSCPTVAGSYLMGRAAVNALYPDELPERGGIGVQMPAPENEGTTGVIAQVLTLLTGATADNGFKGLAGRFARNHLMAFAAVDNNVDAVEFFRLDNNVGVTVALDVGPVPVDPSLRELMMPAVHGQADAAQQIGRAHV